MSKNKSAIIGILKYRCPSCKTGKIFVQPSIFPLKKFLNMNEQCSECACKFKGENNNGPGINYALTTILLFLNVLWYYPIFGLSYKDNSIFYFLGASTFVVILMQPILMRLSRVLYLYILEAFKA